VSDLSANTASVPAELAAPDTHTAQPYTGGPRVDSLRPGDPALAQLAEGAAAVRRFEARLTQEQDAALLTMVSRSR